MKKVLLTHTSLNSFIIQPESYGATVDEGFIVGGPVGDFELLLCHGTVCVVGKMRDLILQLSKSSIYSTKPFICLLCAAIHAIGYELVDNGLSYFNTAMATELGHFNDCDRIL